MIRAFFLLAGVLACNNFTAPAIPPPAAGPAPDTTLSGGPPPRSRTTTATFQISSTDAAATFLCSLDGARFAACTSPASFSGLSAGAHTFRAYAVLADGRFDASPASHAWEVVTTPVETAVTSAPPQVTSSPNALIAFLSPSDPDATFECALDGAGFAACTSPRNLSGLSDGVHTLRVRAIDAEGNADGTPAEVAWRVDTTAPAVTLLSVPTDIVEIPETTFAFAANEENVRLYCRLDTSGYAPCQSPHTLSGLTPGVHQFSVIAEDLGGNRSTPANAGFEVRWGRGTLCSANEECRSNICKDGVCCNEACTDTCRSCALVRGTCSVVRNSIDIDTCSGDNACDATGTCRPAQTDPTAGFELVSQSYRFRGRFPANRIELESPNVRFQGQVDLTP